MLVAALAIVAVLFPSLVSGVTIPAPKPEGQKHVVAHEHSYLVQTRRKDQYNPVVDRKLAISLFILVLKEHCLSYCNDAYMLNKTSKVSNLQFFGNGSVGIFESFSFQSCCASSALIETKGMKVVVLEPGAGTSRLLYTLLARQLAALNVAVVTIDHPYDSPIVEFEDHIGAEAGESPALVEDTETETLDAFSIGTEWNETMFTALNTRRADIHFVLDQMREPSFLGKVFPKLQFTGSLNTTIAYMVSHGFGGTVASTMAVYDDRVVWSINLSGTIFPIDKDTYDYTIFFGRVGFTRREDPNWLSSVKHFRGPFTEWTFAKAGLMDYTDLALLESLSGTGVKAKGTGENGVWAFHCTSCFIEAYVRDTLQNDMGQLTKCLRMCPNMSPYQKLNRI
ncbi:hypothetical protein CC80DRAFT_552684 [Byssothecium circinans]|uniref:Uncharacterized protein n=1 Tax=Byssothecium circinans TaxID=147558 RepID=A0A6A5TI37_9PLEO|nr:hypothetical protein CC80DRAFT_552684 [Byssothecium circinans]